MENQPPEKTNIKLELTKHQVEQMIKILKNYRKLRKSHFWHIDSGLKQAKITDLVVEIDGMIAYLESKNV